MRLSRALALTHEVASATHSLDELGALLDPDLVSTALETAGVATLRKRRLPLEAMIWCVIAMALFRRMSAWDAASRMGIMLPGQKPLVAPSAIVQGRQRLGSAAVREVFSLTQQRWHASVVESGKRLLAPQHCPNAGDLARLHWVLPMASAQAA